MVGPLLPRATSRLKVQRSPCSRCGVWISSNRKALARPQDHPGFSRKLYEVGFVEGASTKLLHRVEFDLTAECPLTHGRDLSRG